MLTCSPGRTGMGESRKAQPELSRPAHSTPMTRRPSAGPLPQRRPGHGAQLLGAAWAAGAVEPAEHVPRVGGRLRLRRAQPRRPGEGGACYSYPIPTLKLGTSGALPALWLPPGCPLAARAARAVHPAECAVASCLTSAVAPRPVTETLKGCAAQPQLLAKKYISRMSRCVQQLRH